jgi:hypothetical protein
MYLIEPVRPRFNRGPTIEPWTSAFIGSMTGPVLLTLVSTVSYMYDI